MTRQTSRTHHAEQEPESSHLRRIAQELAGANRPATARLVTLLNSGTSDDRFSAAEELARLADRESITALRRLLESEEPNGWLFAVHGLRSARDRSGWLCLESVAQDSIPLLSDESPDVHRPVALRLLAMGRTKTMDRLFRAIDGHSRSIPRAAARNFIGVALETLPADESKVLALRLGYPDGYGHTVGEVASVTNLGQDAVRRLEASGWERVQSPRPWAELGYSP